MSMEVFRRRKFGGEPGAVPDDGHGDVFLVIDNYAGAGQSSIEALLDTGAPADQRGAHIRDPCGRSR